MAAALVNKGVAVGALGRREEELDLYDDVVARFSNVPDILLRRQIVKALYNKALVYAEKNQKKAARATFADVIAKIGDDADPELHRVLKNAKSKSRELKTKVSKNRRPSRRTAKTAKK